MDKVESILVVAAKADLVLNQVYISEQLKILRLHLFKGGPNSQGFIYYYEKFTARMENISGWKVSVKPKSKAFHWHKSLLSAIRLNSRFFDFQQTISTSAINKITSNS